MTRTLATALALGALTVALLTGCNQAKAEAPAPPPQQPAAVTVTRTPPAGTAKTDVDGRLDDVDGLLNQVDNQLKADSQNAPDAD
jgi:uncharacterized lipoprotein YbaY